MDAVGHLLETWGYALLVAVGFTAEVAGIVEWISGFASIAAAVAVLLVLSAVGWRVVRARIHTAGHAAALIANSDATLPGVARPVHHPPTIQPRTA